MTVLYLILLLLAGVCFAVAAARGSRQALDHGRSVNLVALGLLFWVAVPFLQTLKGLVD